MKWFTNLSVPLKLAVGFGAVVLALAYASFSAVASFSQLEQKMSQVSKQGVDNLSAFRDAGDNLRLFRIYHYQVYLKKNQDEINAFLDGIPEKRAAVVDQFKKYEQGIEDQEDRKNYENLMAAWDEYVKADDEWCAFLRQGKLDEATKHLTQVFAPLGNKRLDPAFQAITKWNVDRAKKIAKESQQVVAASRQRAVTVALVAMILASAFGIVLTRMITRPIRELSDRLASLDANDLTNMTSGVQALERGDLTYEVESHTEPIDNPSKDDIGQMCGVFNQMLDKVGAMIASYKASRNSLSGLIQKVQRNAMDVETTGTQLASAASETGQAAASIAHTCQQVSSATEEAARSSQQIAQGSEQLAATATEAAAAMERLSKAIAAVTEGSQKQAKAAEEAALNVKSGIFAVEQTVATMQKIELQVKKSSDSVRGLGEKSQQIGEIVQTIEDIAQQTNLLALNAAIEAARAGEQGKGFAVVADEVRKLAERSALATQEIGALIESVRTGVEDAVKAMDISTEQVTEGAARSQEAGSALEKIKETTFAVSEATEANKEAVEEMVKGAEMVSTSISTVASVSEENAAAAEEMSATTEEVSASVQTVTASTEQTSASVQQVGAAAQQLNSMAAELNALVAQFKVNASGKAMQAELHLRKAA